MITAREKVEPGKALNCSIPHDACHCRVVGDGVQRRDMRICETVPKYQLSTILIKATEIRISRVIEAMQLRSGCKRLACELQILQSVICGRVVVICQMFECASRD